MLAQCYAAYLLAEYAETRGDQWYPAHCQVRRPEERTGPYASARNRNSGIAGGSSAKSPNDLSALLSAGLLFVVI